MITHDRAIELAAVAVDFPLSAADREAVQRHLDGCTRCRTAAAAVRLDAERLAALRRPQMDAARAEAVRARLERRTPLFSPAWAVVLVALALLAMVAALWAGAQLQQHRGTVVVSPEPGPSLAIVSPSPAPSASVEPTGSTAPSPRPTAAAAWHAVPAPDVTEGAEYGLVFAGTPAAFAAADGTTALAGGLLRDCTSRDFDIPAGTCRLSAWAYRPATGWSDLTAAGLQVQQIVNTSGPQLGVTAIAVGPTVAVLGGYDALPGTKTIRAGLWWAGPDLAFRRATIDGAKDADITSVAAWGDGFVASGVVHGTTPRAALWTSPDGRTWTRVADTPAFDIGGYFDTMETPSHGGPVQVVAGRNGLVAVGSTCDAKGGACRLVSWRSADGVAWERGDAAPGLLPYALAVDGTGGSLALVDVHDATGNRTGSAAVRSTDGLSWALVDTANLGVGRAAVVGLEQGFAVVDVGGDAYTAGTWQATGIGTSGPLDGWLPAAASVLPKTSPPDLLWLVRTERGVLLAAVPMSVAPSKLAVAEGPTPAVP